MFGKGGLGGMMKQAQEMQEKMKQAQEEVANLEVEAEAGAGMVKVVMTGRFDVKRVKIDPSLMDDDKDLLEDLVAAAINAAVRKVESAKEARMAEVTKGINLPPGMNLPF